MKHLKKLITIIPLVLTSAFAITAKHHNVSKTNTNQIVFKNTNMNANSIYEINLWAGSAATYSNVVNANLKFQINKTNSQNGFSDTETITQKYVGSDLFLNFSNEYLLVDGKSVPLKSIDFIFNYYARVYSINIEAKVNNVYDFTQISSFNNFNLNNSYFSIN